MIKIEYNAFLNNILTYNSNRVVLNTLFSDTICVFFFFSIYDTFLVL